MQIVMTEVKKTRFSIVWILFSILLSTVFTVIGTTLNDIELTVSLLLWQVPLYVGVIVFHELIHIGWKFVFGYTGRLVTVKNGTSRIITFIVNEPIKYRHFLIIVASPFLFINVGFLFCLPFGFNTYFFIAILFNNIGCSIDAYLIYKATKIRPQTITVNNGVVTFN